MLMHESVVPIRARKTVMAWMNMNHQPASALPNSQVPTITIMSPIGALEPAAVRQRVAGIEEVTGGEVFDQVADHALDEQREQHRPRNVALGVLGLFAHRGDRLESDQDQDRDAGLNDDVS